MRKIMFQVKTEKVPAVTNKVSWYKVLLSVTQDALEIALRLSPEKAINILLENQYETA